MLEALGTQQLAKQKNFCSAILHCSRGRQHNLTIYYSINQVHVSEKIKQGHRVIKNLLGRGGAVTLTVRLEKIS